MKLSDHFVLSFFGLKEGNHKFEYKIDKQFFESYNYDEFIDADFTVVLDFTKKSTLLELHFSFEGSGTVACDVTNEPFQLPMTGTLDLVVKFGEAYNDDNEEVLILPHGEHQMNVSQYIYEMIVLAVPLKKQHPGIAAGTLDSEILKKLDELSPDKHKESNDIDPRWEDLKKLIIDKNK
jgi:uncharacterized metal-binding protein YceD (DUF177 family)